MKKVLLATTIALAAMSSADAAETSTLFRQVNQYWAVYIDPSAGNGCYATANYTVPGSGQVWLRIGFENISHHGYMMLSNSNWTSIVPNQTYSLTVRFNEGANSVIWPALGHRMMNGTPALFVSLDDQGEMYGTLMLSTGFNIWFDGNVVLRANLPGSAAALSAVFECQKLTLNSGNSSDPFTGNHSVTTDPFKGT